MFYEQKRFTLITETTKLELTNDPINWKEVETTLARSKTSDGIFLEIKQNLEFVKDGFDFLNLLRIRKGTNVRVQLMVESFFNNCWNLTNIGFLNLQTAKWDEIKFTCDYYDDTFNETFKNNFKEKFEVDRTDSIDGVDIGEVDSSTINLSGRQIFLQSRLELDIEQDNIFENFDQVNGFFIGYVATPLLQKYESDNNIAGFVSSNGFGLVNTTQLSSNATSQNFFYQAPDETRIVNIIIDGTFTVDPSTNTNGNALVYNIERWRLNGVNYEKIDIVSELYSNVAPTTGTLTFDGEVQINEGDFLFAGFRLAYQFDELDPPIVVELDYESYRIDVNEESYFEATTAPVITLKELGQRLVSIIEPTALFESTLIDDNWSEVTVSSGESVRNVFVKSKDDEDNEILIPTPLLTTSFEEFYNLIFTLEPCSFDVLLREGQNVVVLEKIDYFLDNDDMTKVGNVTNIEYETDGSKLFGSIDIGYSKSGENEEVYGLEVTHTVNSFTTPLDIDNAYEATCNYITDPNEQELTRRKQYSILPNTDSQYDKNVMVFDSIKVEKELYAIRPESERFTSVSGVFSPETIYNSIFSPMNCLLRHGKWFKNDLGRSIYVSEKIRYASSKGNVSLDTQLIGEVSRKENDDITISDLENPIIQPITITCIAPYSFKLEKQLRDITAGKRNAYKLIEVKTENGNTVFGYLYKADIKDVIKLELKQAYGF